MNINKINKNRIEIQSTNNIIIKIINKNKIIVIDKEENEKNIVIDKEENEEILDFFVELKNKRISIDKNMFIEPFFYKKEYISRGIRPIPFYKIIYKPFCMENNQEPMSYRDFRKTLIENNFKIIRTKKMRFCIV